MKLFRTLLLSIATLPLAVLAAVDFPGNSIYQLHTPLETQANTKSSLDVYRGSPVVISMFYGSCPNVCPMLISGIQRMERDLPAAQRGRLRVLMVSLDPARDTPDRLQKVARRHGVDASRWTLARTDARQVRKLAAALGVQYRQLPDGEFNHSTVITLLNGEGQPLASTSQALRPESEFTAALKAATTKLAGAPARP